MSGGLGLEVWEIREARRTVRASLAGMLLFMPPAAAAAGPYWFVPAYAAGAALAWAALRMDGAPGPGRRLRRVLAWTCEWDLRFVLFPLMALALLNVFAEFMSVLLEPLSALGDPAATKAEIAAAVEEGFRQIGAKAAFWIALVVVSGVVFCLLSGVSDWLVLGALGARHGVGPWRVLCGRGALQDRRELAGRDLARRQGLLRGRPAVPADRSGPGLWLAMAMVALTAAATLGLASLSGAAAEAPVETPEARSFALRVAEGPVLAFGVAERLPGAGAGLRIGFAVTCERADGRLEALLSFGTVPRGKRVQAAAGVPGGPVERFGPVTRGGGAAAGFHDPLFTDREDVLRFMDAAFVTGALVSNGHNSVWNRIGVQENREARAALRRCAGAGE